MPELNELDKLERELAQLLAQMPRHSLPPAIQVRIDDLEEQIAALRAASARPCDDGGI